MGGDPLEHVASSKPKDDPCRGRWYVERVKTFRAGLPVGRKGQFFIVLLLVGMVLPARVGIHNAFTAVLLLLALVTLALMLVPSRIEVAADGVFLRWLLFSRFVPFSDVVNVWYEPGKARGLLRRGESSRLILQGANGPRLSVSARGGLPDLQQAAVAIEAEMNRYAASGERVPFDGARLARSGTSSADWLARIRALVRTRASYREAPPSREELVRIVADAHVSEEQRAAAAIGLAALGEEGKSHLRVARETTADPKLRVAIDAAIADDDDAIAAALDDVAVPDREQKAS